MCDIFLFYFYFRDYFSLSFKVIYTSIVLFPVPVHVPDAVSYRIVYTLVVGV